MSELKDLKDTLQRELPFCDHYSTSRIGLMAKIVGSVKLREKKFQKRIDELEADVKRLTKKG